MGQNRNSLSYPGIKWIFAQGTQLKLFAKTSLCASSFEHFWNFPIVYIPQTHSY